jgi:TolB protein
MRLINADGTADKQLTNLEGGACPSDWSPDGRLAFVSNGQVLVMTTDGEFARKIAPGYGGRWSPDGKKLLFCRLAADRQSNGSVWIVNEDGTDARKVIDDNSNVLEATWDADGSHILFTSTRVHKHRAEIFRVNIDGSGLQVIATDSDRALYYPVLSPEGRSLIVDRIDDDRNYEDKNIVLLDLASRRKMVLAHGLHASVLWATQ